MISNKSYQYNDDNKTLNKINNEIFGNISFRPFQLDIIQSILNNDDVFVIMPTGGGKSLCYALPAIVSTGVTIVISPLISLIEDQVSNFLQLSNHNELIGIPCAYLTSTCTTTMTKSVIADLSRIKKGLEPYLKLLYITPEGIVKGQNTFELLKVLYNNENLARFVIDEAHCVSSWGHDFRKDYSQLGILKQNFPLTPIVALTATARPSVASDVIKILNIPSCRRLNTGYDRKNLYFEVREKPAKFMDTMNSILQYIRLNHPEDATGIIYCMTKVECESTSDFLREQGIKADYYHAGQTKGDRKLVQGNWLSGNIKVVCATIAYGMGIDKKDVRYVIHLSLAKSLEGYYQEAGRAGRDGLQSHCIIYYKKSDVNSLARIMMKFPARKLSKKDKERLEEMEEYCENKSYCRRKLFYNKFVETSIDSRDNKFESCKNMCDICLMNTGSKLLTSQCHISNKPIVQKSKFHKASEIIKDSFENQLNQRKSSIILDNSLDDWIDTSKNQKKRSISSNSNDWIDSSSTSTKRIQSSSTNDWIDKTNKLNRIIQSSNEEGDWIDITSNSTKIQSTLNKFKKNSIDHIENQTNEESSIDWIDSTYNSKNKSNNNNTNNKYSN